LPTWQGGIKRPPQTGKGTQGTIHRQFGLRGRGGDMDLLPKRGKSEQGKVGGEKKNGSCPKGLGGRGGKNHLPIFGNLEWTEEKTPLLQV